MPKCLPAVRPGLRDRVSARPPIVEPPHLMCYFHGGTSSKETAGRMDSEQWKQIETLFHQLQGLPEIERDGFLNNAGISAEVRRELESLLANDHSSAGLLRPVLQASLKSIQDDRIETPTVTLPPGWTESALVPGMTLGGRYEILNMLGEGGMGAVYKARDREVDRFVALKVIRPELADKPEILRRFTQELILARQITHENVVRIFDIGKADGMKFITMEYIDGVTLKSVIEQRGKLTLRDALPIVRQICQALEAAHSNRVVHRDLKPHNIMIDHRGKAIVMDFGIARSLDESDGTTVGPIGSIDYMSPEQARGETVDDRSDIFSFGIIFYQLLTGQVPFKAENARASMLLRTLKPATPPAQLDPSVPPVANQIIVKCLKIDPAHRYQNVGELLSDLEAVDPAKLPSWWDRLRARRWKPVAAMAAMAAIGLLSYAIVDYVPGIVQPHKLVTPKPVQVLLADFTTSDAALQGTVEPILGLALEGASFIQSVNRAQARNTARQLQGATALSEPVARVEAVRQGIDYVLSGSVLTAGAGYRITTKVVKSSSGESVAAAEIDADRKDALPAAIGRLAINLRTALGDASSSELKSADAETFSAASLEALQSYTRAQRLREDANWEEAIRYYTDAIKVDPNMGRAYSGIAAAYANTGRTAEAETYYQLALEHIDRMTDREKYRTRSLYYILTKNTDKAIEELNELLAQYPADGAARNNLAISYLQRRDMPRALAEIHKFLELYPQNDVARNNAALFAMYAGDFKTARDGAEKLLQSNPSIAKAYLVVAMADLAFEKFTDQAIEQYRSVRSRGATGASLASAGLADVALFEGRSADAIALLTQGVSSDLAAGNHSAAASKLATLSTVHLARMENAQASSAADRAVSESKDYGVAFQAAGVYIALQQPAKARGLVKQLESRLEAEPRAYAKLLEGEMDLSERRPLLAVDKFREAQKFADTWVGRLALGRAYLEMGSFAEASSEFDQCFKRRGEATAIFLDDIPSFHVFPEVYYYLGRSAEGLKSSGAAQWYKTFVSLKQKADHDPLVTDARRRLAANGPS